MNSYIGIADLNFIIVTESPIWFIIFCIALGATYATVLYGKNQSFSSSVKAALAIFRFLTVTILAFFLLSPMLKALFREVEKPIIVVAQDNSHSLTMGNDSAFYNTEYKKNIQSLVEILAEKHDVKTFSYGEKVSENISFEFNEKQTDIAQMLDEIHSRYNNRNVGAIILAGDGMFNKGANPVYASSGIKSPVYTIALGDTLIKKDLILKKVLYNKMAYLGNQFPLEIMIGAYKLKGQNAELKIVKDKETIFTKLLEITSHSFNIQVPLQIEAKEKGIQKYSVRLSHLDGEVSYSNNISDIYIDVLDGKQKILIVVNSPHPDIRALRETIENSDNYEADVAFINEIKVSSLKSYNLIILHQIPSVRNPVNNFLQTISNEKIPALYIPGFATEWTYFNNQQTGLNFTGSHGKTNDAQPLVDKIFSLFTLSDELRTYSKNFPPLQTLFGNYKMSSTANVLFFQKIGMVETRQPLVFFNQLTDGRKVAVIAGEGIWRWRLNDFAQHGNHNIFNEFLLKTIQYLAVKENKNKFRITGKNNFQENEQVSFDAELYNESYELINEPEINFEIINEEEKKFPFSFGRTEKAYHLNAGMLPAGNYKYEAHTNLGGQILAARGEFAVSAIQLEAVNTVADHQLLFNLARKHNGKMLYPSQLAEIPTLLNERNDIIALSYTHIKLSDFIQVKWIFFLLLLLLTAEWFIRKRSGSY